MFALDLFNNDHERRLAEGAVDRLEQRRIDDLAMKMDDLVARARQVTDPAHKAALVREFQKCKAERDSYYKIKDECMGYGTMVGEDGIGQDIVNKTEKMARATPPSKAGAVASTVKNAAKWLAGKGGPGKEGPTYEAAQKKNSEKSVDSRLERLKVQARHAHPGAKTDDEALALHILDKEQNDFTQLSHENEREDRMIARLNDLEQNLQQQINDLTSTDVNEDLIDAIVDYAVDMYNGEQGAEVVAKAVDTALDEESANPKLNQLIKMIQAGKITAAGLKDPAVRPRIMQLVQQADPQANIDQLVATYAPAPEVKATNVNDLKAQARSGNVMAQLPKTSAGTPSYSQQYSTFEGFQDFNKVEPYAVCLAGKPVKQFDYYEDARRFHDNWKKKLYREGNKEKADKITLMPIMDEGVVGQGSWIVYDPETKQIKKRFKTHTAGKSYAKAHSLGFASSEYYFDNIKQPVTEFAPSPERDDNDDVPNQILKLANRWWNAAGDQPKIENVLRSLGWSIHQVESEDDAVQLQHNDGTTYFISADDFDPEVFEVATDYSKRRQREKDIDAGKPVAKQRQPRMTDYQKRRAQQKKELELGEESSTGSEDAERAILNRIMVARTDLLMKFGPEKVMQAVEEVAYNVGDLDEIGTSDVSGWVRQVEEILGQ